MDSKYDKFKKLMSEDREFLPPELSWENMEAGILKKMEKLQTQEHMSNTSKQTTIIRRGFMILILLMLIFCNHNTSQFHSIKKTAFTPNNFNQSSITDQFDNNLKSDQPETAEEETTSDESIPTNKKEQSNLAFTPGLPPVKPPSTNPNTDNEKGNLSAQTAVADKEQDTSLIANTPSSLSSSENEGNDKFQESKNSTETELASERLNSNDAVNELGKIAQIDAGLSIPMEFLPATSLPLLRITKNNHLPELPQLDTPSDRQSKKLSLVPDRLSLLGGVSFWNMGFGQEKPDRQPYEQTHISFHSQLNYLHTLKKNFTLLVGLQYVQLEHQFDWTTSIEDYKITLKDTILEVQTNSLTGQQTPVYGDVELETTATRTVRHHNRVRLVQVPVAIGKTWTIKNWQADLLIGGAVNVLTQNTGRTLYQGTLQEYDGRSTDLLENQWNIHGLLMGRLGYNFNDHFGITTGFQVQKSLNNWSAEQHIKMRPAILSWEMGVSYRFD